MKKLVVASFMLLSLAGCGYFDVLSAAAKGHQAACVGGVEYLQFSTGVSVAYTEDGKVKTCKTQKRAP